MALVRTTFAAAGLLIASITAPAMADTYHHIDDLALSIDRQAKLIVQETRHYIHTPEYRHLLEDSRDLCRLASHLHDVAHHHGSLAHLESDVRQLDAKFHHLESVFHRVERRAAHGQGHIHGGTAHVAALLHSIEDSIHHLQDDIRSLRNPHYREPRVIVQRPAIYSPPRCTTVDRHYDNHGYHSYRGRSHGGGITIGGGSSRFTIRF